MRDRHLALRGFQKRETGCPEHRRLVLDSAAVCEDDSSHAHESDEVQIGSRGSGQINRLARDHPGDSSSARTRSYSASRGHIPGCTGKTTRSRHGSWPPFTPSWFRACGSAHRTIRCRESHSLETIHTPRGTSASTDTAA